MITTNNAFNTLDLLDSYAEGFGKDPFSVRYDLVNQLEVSTTVTLSFESFCRLDKVAFVVYGKSDWVEAVSVYNGRGAVLLEEVPGGAVNLPSVKSLYSLFNNVDRVFGR